MKPRTLTIGMIRRMIPERPRDAHKGDFGHALIIAGSRGMGGAAALAGLGALRSGVGLVTMAVPESQQRLAATAVPEALSAALPEADGRLSPACVRAVKRLVEAKRFTAVALGPGIGAEPSMKRVVLGLLNVADGLPLVLDADALNALASLPGRSAERLLRARKTPAILTPHPGELARLLRCRTRDIQADRIARALEAARRFGAVCLLKGHRTVITDGKIIFVNPTGNPGMAKGGMGDVLTGLIAGFLAQEPAQGAGAPELGSACLGAFVHGSAGDLAAKKTSRAALLARDLAAALPRALRKIER